MYLIDSVRARDDRCSEPADIDANDKAVARRDRVDALKCLVVLPEKVLSQYDKEV